MNKVNFHSIENMTVSDELNERLLSIPSLSGTEPAFTPRLRYIAAAACLTAVTALAVALYPKTGDSRPIELISAPTDTAEDNTERNVSIEPTSAQTESTAQVTQSAGVKPTQAPTSAPTDILPYQYSQQEAEARQEVPARQSETAQTPSALYHPSEAATEAPAQSETEQPYTQPADAATEYQTEEPAEAPTVTPTDSRELAPTAKWINYLSQQSLSGVIQSGMLTGSGKVYFRLYAFDGSPLGDEDLFSDSNLAVLMPNRYDTVTASYYLGGLADDLVKIQKGDCLTYRFFNEDGDLIFSDIKIF